MGYVRSNAYDQETRTSTYASRSTGDIFKNQEAKPEYLHEQNQEPEIQLEQKFFDP